MPLLSLASWCTVYDYTVANCAAVCDTQRGADHIKAGLSQKDKNKLKDSPLVVASDAEGHPNVYKLYNYFPKQDNTQLYESWAQWVFMQGRQSFLDTIDQVIDKVMDFEKTKHKCRHLRMMLALVDNLEDENLLERLPSLAPDAYDQGIHRLKEHIHTRLLQRTNGELCITKDTIDKWRSSMKM